MRPTQKRSVACAIGRIMKLTTAGSASDAIRLSSSSPKRHAARGGGGVPAAASSGEVAPRLCRDGPLRLSSVGPAAAGSSASAQAGSSSGRSSRRWCAIDGPEAKIFAPSLNCPTTCLLEGRQRT
jgi:hypothetical protein